MKPNPLDQQAAKAAAKRLFQKVSFSGGSLQSYQISSLLADTYAYLQIPFTPNSRDIKSYSEVLDANRDGQVTLGDFETLAIQYLCGSDILTNQTFDPATKKQKFQTPGISINSYSNNYPNNNLTSQLQPPYNPSLQPKPTPINQQKITGNSYSQSNSTNQAQYNEQTSKHLLLTRSIFKRNATQKYTITADRVPQLLTQTYETLGRKGYHPNEQDVRVWMKLCDGNGDGEVEQEQYEYFVVRSLQRSGFQVYK